MKKITVYFVGLLTVSMVNTYGMINKRQIFTSPPKIWNFNKGALAKMTHAHSSGLQTRKFSSYVLREAFAKNNKHYAWITGGGFSIGLGATILSHIKENPYEVPLEKKFHDLLEAKSIDEVINELFTFIKINKDLDQGKIQNWKTFKQIIDDKFDTKEKKLLITAIINNFNIIAQYDSNNFWCDFMSPLLIECDEQQKKSITDTVIAHFDIVANNKSCHLWDYFLCSLIQNMNLSEKDNLMLGIINNFSTLLSTNVSDEYICFLTHMYHVATPSEKEKIKNCAIACFDNNLSMVSFRRSRGLCHNLILPLYEKMCSDEKANFLQLLCEKLSSNKPIQSILYKIKDAIEQNIFTTRSCSTQTECHVKNNTHLFINDSNTLLLYLFSPALHPLLQESLSKEQELQSQGYTTFYHAQRWRYNLAEEWYKNLWEVEHTIDQKDLKEFEFAHIKSFCNTQECFEKEKETRKYLLTNGRETYEDRQRLLFVNMGLFNNESTHGSSTAKYFYNNTNAGYITVSLKKIFKDFNHLDIYQQFKQELKNLKKEHQDLGAYGNLLMYAIPTENLDRHVYECVSGGAKKWPNNERSMQHIIQHWHPTKDPYEEYAHNKEFKHIRDVISLTEAALPRRPKEGTDKREFCIIMTQDNKGALSPNSGIKVFSFHAADPEKYTSYKQKSAALWTKIEQAILAKKNKITTQA